MARRNDENAPSSVSQNNVVVYQHDHGTRKRKRAMLEASSSTEPDSAEVCTTTKKRLTTRQKALQQKEQGDKESPATEAMFAPTAVKQMSEEQKFRKSQQAEKRKRQKEEQMEVQKDAILQKIANAVNARSDPAVGAKEKRKKRDSLGEVRYVNSKSGAFLSFAPHVPVPSYLSLDSGVLPRGKKVILCITGCGNPHKYYDSKTQQPLCSLGCYRIHHQQITTSSQTEGNNPQTPGAPVFQTVEEEQGTTPPQNVPPKIFLPQNAQQQLPSPGLETLA